MLVPDLETLRQYTELGIKLAAVDDCGVYVEQDLNIRFTNDIEAIKEMIEGKYIFSDTSLGIPIKVFKFIPKEAGFLCLDIDYNNGITNLQKIAKNNNIDFENTYYKTTCVKTPYNGYHFYFKFKREREREMKEEICPGVEVKYKQALTAAGSVEDGKIYELIGTLKGAKQYRRNVLKMAENKAKKYFNYDPRYKIFEDWRPRFLAEAMQIAKEHKRRAYIFANKCKKNNYRIEQATETIFANPDIFGIDHDLYNIVKKVFYITPKKRLKNF